MIGKDLQYAAELLCAGSLVAIPTETVYGLAANALNEEAILEIFKSKNRPFFDPLIVHIHSVSQLQDFAMKVPDAALQLAKLFWPGSLTLVLKKNDLIPDLVTSGIDTVALRVPNHPMTLELLKNLDFPLAAPSANPFGYISPTSAQHVQDQLGKQIAYILDGGDCSVGVESTIVGFDENEKPMILRLGGISVESIERVTGPIEKSLLQHSNPQAPGQLNVHYAPRTPLVLCDDMDSEIKKYKDKKVAILRFSEMSPKSVFQQLVLSRTSNIDEAARNLFKSMRTLDKLEADVILAEKVPDKGLGKAINDRLKRASVR